MAAEGVEELTGGGTVNCADFPVSKYRSGPRAECVAGEGFADGEAVLEGAWLEALAGRLRFP